MNRTNRERHNSCPGENAVFRLLIDLGSVWLWPLHRVSLGFAWAQRLLDSLDPIVLEAGDFDTSLDPE